MPHRLVLYAHRNEPDLLGLGLLVLLLIVKGVCHYLLNQKFECKLRRNSGYPIVFQNFLKVFNIPFYNYSDQLAPGVMRFADFAYICEL